jgi:predicted Zn-dependent protease
MMRARPLGRVTAMLVVAALVTAPSHAAAIGLSEERQLGARFALEARVQLPLLRAPAVTAYLREVGGRLISRMENQPFAYRFFTWSATRT